MEYANKLRNLREEKELTQQEIANIININRVQYNQYENDYNTIPLRHLNKLCNLFDVSLDYMFNLSSNKQYINSKKDIDSEILKKRLKEFRKENKLTQIKIAQDFKIARTTITEYERGINLISTTFLYSICKKYNISADYLLGRIDDPKYLN